jgi:uncharacterized protein
MATSTVETFEVRDFPGTGATAGLITRITTDMEPFWNGLNEGHLVLQECSSCHKLRYPVAPVCPYDQSEAYEWKPVSSEGSVFSWIRYHKSYLPEFESLMPYTVLTVQLDAGPRMFSRLAADVEPEIGMRVHAIGERWSDGRIIHAFVPVG